MLQKEEEENLAGLSLTTIVLTVLGLVLFVTYAWVLLDHGDNSWSALNRLHQKKEDLIQSEKRLKQENQKLQKVYFELKQLEAKD